MNTNEHGSDPRALLRQKLVAVLLGEAGAQEVAELERALASDPELASERARLEATIGLVEGLKGADAGTQLSPAATERLTDAAAQRATGPWPLAGPQPFSAPGGARRAWYASPVFRFAASVALLAGAFAAWRASEGATERSKEQAFPADELTAALEKRARDFGEDERKNEPASSTGLAVQPAEAPAAAAAPEARMGLEEDAGRKDDQSLLLAQIAREDGVEATQSQLLGEKLRLLDEAQARGEAPSVAKSSELRFQPEAQPGEAKPEGVYSLTEPSTPLTAEELSKLPSGATGGTPLAVGPAPTTAQPAAPPEVIDRFSAPAELAKGQESTFSGRRAGASAAPASPGVSGVPVIERIDSSTTPPSDGSDAAKQITALGYAGTGGAGSSADQKALEALRSLGYASGLDYDDDRFHERDGEWDQRFAMPLERLRQLTPAERAVLTDELIRSCRRRPQERPRDMFYRWWGDNSFEWARTDPLSTFAVDVDTASYTLARRYLAEHILPEKAQIRTEEFVNYFKGDVQPPSEETFRIATELAPSLFNSSPDTWMLRVALRGREVSRTERKPVALTFVVDVSGSMREQNRLELVKHALRLLVGELDARDTIAIVAFTNDARLVLPATSARHRGLIESAIHPLQPEGGTNVQAGLRMGYQAAVTALAESPELAASANHRVVLLSDGVGNIGATDAATLTAEVERQRASGIYLNTVGVGMNNHNDTFLEQLADKGDGVCNYVDDEREARRALVENFTGAFEAIARDAKIQVEFDPSQVERYRLLGYENRAVADRDFRNDAVDAGEVGAGHQVVALYEVVRTGRSDAEKPLATVRVRWMPPQRAAGRIEAEMAREIDQPVFASQAAGSFAATSAGYRRSVLVGQLAEFLRRSIHARDDRFDLLLGESRKLAPELGDPDFDEFVRMVERTVDLITAEWGRYEGLAKRLDELRMRHYLRAECEERGQERARLDELDRQIAELEAEVRSICERGSMVR